MKAAVTTLTDTTYNERLQDDTVIYRAATPTALIFRSETGEPTVEGRVMPYNEWTEVDSLMEGHFMERFAPGSLRKSITEKLERMRGFFEHGRSQLFGSQAIMDIREVWEQPDGVYFRAHLLDGLPDLFMDGLRRGLYGASIGAKPIKVDRSRFPRKSAHNPTGLEERTVREARAYDISLTAVPFYAGTQVALRSITDELAVEQLIQNPEKLLQLIRQAAETTEAEPTHSEPTAPDAEAATQDEEPAEPQEEPAEEPSEEQPPAEPEQPEGSRATQPPPDYLSDETEEEWLL